MLRDNSFRRETLPLTDGGTVSIDFLDSGLPPTAPIVIFLHTVTGSAKVLNMLVSNWLLMLLPRRLVTT